MHLQFDLHACGSCKIDTNFASRSAPSLFTPESTLGAAHCRGPGSTPPVASSNFSNSFTGNPFSDLPRQEKGPFFRPHCSFRQDKEGCPPPLKKRGNAAVWNWKSRSQAGNNSRSREIFPSPAACFRSIAGIWRECRLSERGRSLRRLGYERPFLPVVD